MSGSRSIRWEPYTTYSKKSRNSIGIKKRPTFGSQGRVSIKFFIDKDKTGNWILATEAKDDGKTYGRPAILNEGYAGIRTDFMDVEFDNYKAIKF